MILKAKGTQLLDLVALTTRRTHFGLVGFSTAGKLHWMTLCGRLGLRIRRDIPFGNNVYTTGESL